MSSMMKKTRSSFSQKIRDAIQNCGTTRYTLAKQVGISGALLSRFMAGKQGMNLETLDKLAEALGLEVIVTVENVKRPDPKGRKPTKGKKMNTAVEVTDWTELARDFAQDAHQNHFESRRGVWFFSVIGKLCVYNNNPYADDPTRRDAELEEFRRRLKSVRIRELGFGEWPAAGEEKGYTFAMILDCGEDRREWVANAWREIVIDSFRKRL